MWTNGLQLAGAGSSFPADPTPLDVFFRTDWGAFYYYTGSSWSSISLADSAGGPRIQVGTTITIGKNADGDGTPFKRLALFNVSVDNGSIWRESDGLGCLLRRNKFSGTWVAMVCVPPGHPAFGQETDEVFPEIREVAGNRISGNCGYVIPGIPGSETTAFWWIGFDTLHPLAPLFHHESVSPEDGRSKALRDQYQRERQQWFKNEAQTRGLLQLLLQRLRSLR